MRTQPLPFIWPFLLVLVGVAPFHAMAQDTPVEGKSAAQEMPREPFEMVLSYTNVTVGPGQEFAMDTAMINPRKEKVQINLATESVPEGWTAGFHSRYPSYPVSGIMVQGEKSTTLEFKAKLPDKIEPGQYSLTVTAADSKGEKESKAQVTFRVSSKKVETGGLRMDSQYPVLSGSTNQTFKFGVDLKNETGNPLTTSLAAQAPPGWVIRIKPQFEETQISSIALKQEASETLSIEVQPPAQGEPGDYPVVVKSRSGPFTAEANLKVTLTGTYDLRMITPTGALNAAATAGTESQVDLLVANAGSAPLTNLAFISKKPERWEINFTPDKLDSLNPGEVREVKMAIKTPDRAVAGDYMVGVVANSPDTNKAVDLRVTVSTPTIWGWIGAIIVAVVVLGLGAVFVRLGRR